MVASRNSFTNPTTYSLEVWFNTTTTQGGKLIGFGSRATGTSDSYDRHVYMQDDGHLVFGTYTGQMNTITTPGAYNDGKWHSVVATQSSDGMVLYVDGAEVGTNPQTAAQDYTGYWRIGGDTTWGSSSAFFAGTLDEAAVYPSALTAARVATHYQLGTTVPPVNQVPVASFTSTVKDLGITVDGSGSSDSDGTVDSYAWDFGDGSTGQGATATHTYAAAGTYTVKLTVTDNQSATGRRPIRSTVTAPPVNQVPVASFTSTVKDLGVTVDGSGSSDSDGTVDSYAWDFGDGSTGQGATATHTYAAAGTYTVKLTVTDNQSATGEKTDQVTVTAPPVNQVPVASFTSTVKDLGITVDGSGSSDSDGTVDSYAWDFGDGSTGQGATATHTYAAAGTYTVKLTVTDNQSATGEKTDQVTVTAPPVNQVPVASFTSTVKDLGITVDGSGSSDSDGTVDSYAWDFGDGSTGQGATATHTYAAAGTYTVKLTVTDNQSATGEKTDQVTVTAPPVDVVAVPAKSTWSWRYEATAPPAGWKGQGFDASSWKTGNGVLGFGSTGLGTNIDVSTGTSTRPLAAYFIKTFTVDNAASVSKLTLKTVADDGVVVYVNGTEVGRSNMPAGTVTFNTYASSAPRTSVAVASPVTMDVPVFLLQNGANTIAVETHLNYHATADVSFDLSATETVGGTVPNQAPVAKFTSTVSGLGVALDGSTSTDPDGTVASYAWNYGDNTTGTGATPTHTYAAAGTYTVTLTATDNKGAKGVATAPVTVTSVTGPVDVVVVPAKSPWSWRYASTAPDVAWKTNGYDASSWKIGNAVLGFGSTGLGTNIDVPPPTSSRPLAAYFLDQFNVDNLAKVSKLTLNTVADDGVVVYVNGTEVARQNMPAGTVTFSTYASSAISTAKANAAPLSINVPLSVLVAGINTIAVETHLNYHSTPDVSFDLKATMTKQP